MDMDHAGAPLVLTKGLNDKNEAYSPTWSEDSKKILVQDMKEVYILDLGGKVTAHIPIAGLQNDPSLSSASKFWLNKDETRIIFDMEVNDTSALDGPPSAIFSYDRRTKKTLPLSPKGYDCFQPCLKDGRVYFSGRNEAEPLSDDKEPEFNIYSVDMDGRDFRTEFKDRKDLSFRRL